MFNKEKDMLKDNLTLLIHSCGKFSDLWDAHVYLLNKNWADRGVDTFIATDDETDKSYPGVTIVSAGAGKEITERTEYILPQINTKYVLVTLDDYFLTKPIISSKIERLVDIMEEESLDYMRLFYRPKKKRYKTKFKSVFSYDMSGDYVVNLYSGIWRKDFIEKTLGEKLNAWEYEVKLSDMARRLNAKCMVSLGNEFPIMDVVRKGRILNKAHWYLKRHNLYHGDRPVMPILSEFNLFVKTWINRFASKLLPASLYNRMKVALGIKSFSSKQGKND